MCSLPPSPHRELSRETVFNLIDQAARLGIREAVLTGGEPLLRRDLLDVCGHCRIRGVRSIVTTNGTLIDETLARAIAGSGMSHIHFSIDGMETTNDRVRGRGNFEKAVRGIELLARLKQAENRGPSIGVACTVMDHNLEDLPRLLAYADGLGVDVINFQPLLKDNFNTPDRRESKFWVREENWPALDQALQEIKDFKRKHIQIHEEPRLELLRKYYRKTLGGADWQCFGGYKTLFICVGDDGAPRVYTCHGICGNLNEKSLADCWVSKEARNLRKDVKRCRDLCLQSCYSRERSATLNAIVKGFLCRT
jgi:MoaA/NifB/PqqE/SkfB family radical SAM enzyme